MAKPTPKLTFVGERRPAWLELREQTEEIYAEAASLGLTVVGDRVVGNSVRITFSDGSVRFIPLPGNYRP